MDEREIRERLNDSASSFRFGFENSERVVRRIKARLLLTRALAAMLTVGAIVVVATLVTEQESQVAPPPQPPAGPGPTETVPLAPDGDYIIELNTGEMSPLPEAIIRSLGGPVFATEYAVSPDGSRLAYVGPGENESGQIFIAGIDGTGVRQVTHDPGLVAGWLAWSPDGTTIAYGDAPNLFVLDVATGESTQITKGTLHRSLFPRDVGAFAGLQITPDGSSLLYTDVGDQDPVLRTVPVAGGESTLLIGPLGNLSRASNGSLSPDGSLVTFMGSEGEGRPDRRYVANADGTDLRLLPDVYGIPCFSNPAGTWSPDGSRIVCSEASRVIVIDIATGDAAPVAQGRGAIWLDDHTLLVSL
jgi:Tol biopolymer transport system component